MRRAARIDVNQPDVVEALRKAGAEVTHAHSLGGGVCDLFVSYRQRWYAFEVKDGAKPKSKRALTEDERTWIGKQRAPVYVVESAREAVELLNILSR